MEMGWRAGMRSVPGWDEDDSAPPRLDRERREAKEKHANSALTADSKGVRRVHENEIPPSIVGV